MSDNLGQRIEGLSPEKRALLEAHLLRRRSTAGAGDEVIPRRNPGDPAPLSFSQQRLWFLDQWAPGDPMYNAGIALRLDGPVRPERLQAAFARVIERHESLRTVFLASAGTPRQVVLENWTFDLPVVDLSSLPEPGREAGLAGRLRAESRRPFDLAVDLMLRVTLFRLGTDQWVLLVVEHHIAFDGWSDGILFAEVTEVYSALAAGREPLLPQLPVQYADFALWQQRRLTGPLLDRLAGYWQRQLAGAPRLLELPTDRSRPAVQTFAGSHHRFTLGGPELVAGVSALAREEGATAYMTLLAAFVATLHRWAGLADVCVGTPIAGRGRVELEPMVGFFSNTLVLRVQLSSELTFRQLLRRVKETALGAYEHQELPFEKVVETVSPPRDPSHNPLFQVNFRVQASVSAPLRLPEVTVTPLPVDVGFSRFDLALDLHLLDDRVTGYVEYNEALFENATAVRLASRFGHLLRDALERPDTPISVLDLAGAATDTASRPAAVRGFRRHG